MSRKVMQRLNERHAMLHQLYFLHSIAIFWVGDLRRRGGKDLTALAG